MSDYRDTIKNAIENGIILDSCGYDERQKVWGRYIDLCGMSVEDAIPLGPEDCGGGGGNISKNSVTLFMQKNSEEEYTMHISVAKPLEIPITVSYTIDGVSATSIIPAGTTLYDTGYSGKNPQKPYAEISNAVAQTDAGAIKVNNNVQTGIFKLTVRYNETTDIEQLEYGTEYTLPSVAPIEGYDFKWKDGEGVEITGATITMPEHDLTITGEYYVKEYTLTCRVTAQTIVNGEIVETVGETSLTVNFGEKILPLISALTPEKEGSTLDGWKFEGGLIVGENTTMPATNSAVENKYILNKYNVIYLSEGAEFTRSEFYFGQETQLIAETPTKTGYEFVEWLGTLPQIMPSSDVTLTAKFSAVTYYIRYYVDGVKKYEEAHIYGDSITIRQNEEKEGNTFSGWAPSQLPSTMPAENIDVIGTFSVNSYTLTYKVDGVQYSSLTYEYGAQITPIAAPSREGYTFSGWDYVPSTMPANDVVVSGTFSINSHTLAYYVDGNIYSSITYNYGESITPIPQPERVGYTFSGWVGVPSTMPDNDVNVNGTFSINSYVLTYFVNNVQYSSVTYEYDEMITPAESPTMEGYTFGGWQNEPVKMPANDVRVDGTFTVNQYVMTYYVDNEYYSSQTYDYNTIITPIAAPSKEGYTFGGWQNMPERMPANDVRIDGEFSIAQFTLTFIIENQPYTSITADYGTPISVPTPSKEGYTFNGWDKAVPATMPAYNDTFNGAYTINSHVAAYIIDGEPYSSMTYNYGAIISYPDVPKTGYTLNWVKEYVTMPDFDINIIGNYVEISDVKTIYYNAIYSSGDTAVSSVTGMNSYEYENGVETPVVFTIPGNPEYAIAEETLEDDEFNQWCADHAYSMYFAIPSGTTFTIKNEGGVSIDDQTISVGAPFDVDGNTYQGYSYRGNSPCCVSTDQALTYKLTITKL